MKNCKNISTVLLLVLIYIMICACDFGWGWVNDHDGDNNNVETLSTTAIATVDVIYTTEMDVVTDDGVVLTCDLPGDPVLIEGDIVEIIIDFESLGDNWVIINVEFDQKIWSEATN